MSEDEQEWRVREWLDQTTQPQDSVSICGQEVETDKDGRPRIPLQPNVSEAPDVESQAALRRGVAA